MDFDIGRKLIQNLIDKTE